MSGPHTTAAPRHFDADWLARRLKALLAPRQPPYALCVAWSGGADSTALLVALVALRERPVPPFEFSLRAVHVDHHLQAASADFRRHCRRQARRLGVRLAVRDAHLGDAAGRSLEELAREARYALLQAELAAGEILLTGQHAEDQLESVLLQLLRGAGVAGLAGMGEVGPLGAGLLLRPLLEVAGAALRAYLTAGGQPWIEDPTNADPRYDRNYLRRAVLPSLLARWPAAARTVARAARHAAQADAGLRQAGDRDALAAADGPDLDLTILRRYPLARQRAALRAWILARGLALPDEARLAEVVAIGELRADAAPRVRWADVELRRHAGRLSLHRLSPAGTPEPGANLDWDWRAQPSVQLPGEAGTLLLRADPWGDVDVARLPARLVIQFRRGGERVPAGGGHRDVKSLLREAGIPVWQRAGVPFICAAGSAGAGQRLPLLAIGDLWVAQALCPGAASAQRARFIWQPQ